MNQPGLAFGKAAPVTPKGGLTEELTLKN